MERVKQTLWLLIELGADPDFGTVPLPPLILSIFVKCEMLTKELINRGDSNIRTSVDNLSAIHVLCCLPFHQDYLNIFKVLVPVTNLNLRTGTEHWKKEKEVILSTELYKTVLDEGKTALHILSMRYDFEGFENIQWEMFELLLNEGADPNLSYLGHTSLTLAMLRGNIFIVEEMLKRRFVNPNQLLGEGIGVPLTMLLLKRYTNYLPANLCMRFVNLLMDYNANPFVIFSIHGNAVEFLEKEYESSVTKTKESKRDKSKSRQSKGKDKKKKGVYKVLINNFLICSRNFLLRHIQAKVVEYVYLFISEACTEEKYLFHLAKFVNIDEAVQCLQLLIQNRIIAPRENTLNICRDVLNFVRVCNTDSPRKDNKSSSSLANQPPVETMLTNFNLQKNVYVDKKYNSHPPELDKNLDKYVVCYQCCKSVGKELIPCPNCWMVYFCSEICNKSSLQASEKWKPKIDLLHSFARKIRLDPGTN
ncbi:uncharacterized protein LOC108736157 [Agrilus planipennis]|uniref:Uncharacterized protein LOC108736157 n=1 Tax=Agrilus planipennis TaxID=224129 RepID=A0A1W4WU06_AGRPL|nr:uncharacterized protein LOC108736157 [Agrilus planipennis]